MKDDQHMLGVGCPYASTRALEVTLASMMLVCGYILLLPHDTFELPHYSILKLHISEEAGALVFLCTGALRLAALWVNGSRKKTPLLRMAGCLVGSSFWATAAVAMWQAHHVAAAFPLLFAVSLVLFAAEFYSALRCAADASYLGTFREHKRGTTGAAVSGGLSR